MRAHSMRNNKRMLHGDHSRCDENFYWSTTNADLFAVANLLVNGLYFRNRAANIVEICQIYAYQMVIKMAISIICYDKFSRRYDDLCSGITFWAIR